MNLSVASAKRFAQFVVFGLQGVQFADLAFKGVQPIRCLRQPFLFKLRWIDDVCDVETAPDLFAALLG